MKRGFYRLVRFATVITDVAEFPEGGVFDGSMKEESYRDEVMWAERLPRFVADCVKLANSGLDLPAGYPAVGSESYDYRWERLDGKDWVTIDQFSGFPEEVADET